ncbi:DUF3883 domain-containing protein [Patescibacteria group bacterium]|nr:MAG: DUF3883 domain-containing protein [Patescibacteria group bacterium]
MAKTIEQKAMETVIAYEIAEGQNPVNVSKKGVGYDIKSGNRMIEVKGVSENWKTYTWQSLYPSEVKCLGKNAKNFFLYIVKFDGDKSSLYVIPGDRLKKEFRYKVAAYALTPISRKKLKQFLQTQK